MRLLTVILHVLLRILVIPIQDLFGRPQNGQLFYPHMDHPLIFSALPRSPGHLEGIISYAHKTIRSTCKDKVVVIGPEASSSSWHPCRYLVVHPRSS